MNQNNDTLDRVIKELMVGKYNGGFVENMISKIKTMLETSDFNEDRTVERFLIDCSRAVASTYHTTDDEDFKNDLVEVEEIIDTLLML